MNNKRREVEPLKQGGEVLAAIVNLTERKGHSLRLNLPVAFSTWFRQEGITKVQIVQSGLGGSLLVKPIREAELLKELDTVIKND